MKPIKEIEEDIELAGEVARAYFRRAEIATARLWLSRAEGLWKQWIEAKEASQRERALASIALGSYAPMGATR